MNRCLADLFKNASEERLRLTLERLFPEETEDLIAVFHRLGKMEAAAEAGLVLHLDGDGDDVLVSGTNPNTGENFALDLIPWAAYLGLAVTDALMDEFEVEEVIAHVLAEMTFYGLTEESAADTLREVLRRKPEGEGPPVGGLSGA